MMKISLKQEYGIFKKPFEVELPDFTIITGLNGAGKSQLLEAMERGHVFVEKEDGTRLVNLKIYSYGNENHQNKEPLKPYGNDYDTDEAIKQTIKTGIFKEYKNAKDRSHSNKKAIKEVLEQEYSYLMKWINGIVEKSEKEIQDLTLDDFIQHISMDFFIADYGYMSHNFARLFLAYVYKKQHNTYMEFLSKVKKKNAKFYTNQEFISLFGEPPWEFVNHILEKYNSNYRVNLPPLELDGETAFNVTFKDIQTKENINLASLSSGEKVIMALILAIYNSEKNPINFPQLILMDEPDAPLHPSMTKQFLDVIQDVFIHDMGVKVIMTTHSPSTVALAPEKSLFVMKKLATKPTPITKDEALQFLTEGIPTLSINYANRKQVFVESDYDLYFYNQVYNTLKSQLNSPISLNFISSGKPITSQTSKIGTGSSSRVKYWVNELTKAGNKSIYGIIDKDADNKETSNIKVLKRYSIENYIFDPVILSAFLLNEPAIKKVFPVLQAKKYTEFTTYKNKELQPLIDFILDSINIPKEDTSMQEITYQNGVKINIPNWYLSYRGHDLVDKLIMQFEPLKQYEKRENDLQKAILDSVLTDLPGFIPMDIVELFKSIQQ